MGSGSQVQRMYEQWCHKHGAGTPRERAQRSTLQTVLLTVQARPMLKSGRSRCLQWCWTVGDAIVAAQQLHSACLLQDDPCRGAAADVAVTWRPRVTSPPKM